MEIWVKCYVKITMGKSRGDMQTVYYRKDLSVDFFHKWSWYFRYRAALFQVQNPRYYVEYSHGSYDYVPQKEEVLKRLKDRITAKKAKVTKINNEWKILQENWNSLFPITEDPRYKATVKAIQNANNELLAMQQEYEAVEKD